jgi:hypothetical protein
VLEQLAQPVRKDQRELLVDQLDQQVLLLQDRLVRQVRKVLKVLQVLLELKGQRAHRQM